MTAVFQNESIIVKKYSDKRWREALNLLLKVTRDVRKAIPSLFTRTLIPTADARWHRDISRVYTAVLMYTQHKRTASWRYILQQIIHFLPLRSPKTPEPGIQVISQVSLADHCAVQYLDGLYNWVVFGIGRHEHGFLLGPCATGVALRDQTTEINIPQRRHIGSLALIVGQHTLTLASAKGTSVAFSATESNIKLTAQQWKMNPALLSFMRMT